MLLFYCWTLAELFSFLRPRFSRFSQLENEEVGFDLSQGSFCPPVSPLRSPDLMLPLAVPIPHCQGCWDLGVGTPNIEVGRPGLGLSELFH